MTTPGEYLRGREMTRPFHAKVDAVIVGSGASGAVLARELARDGRSVLVLEEGGHYTKEQYGAMPPAPLFHNIIPASARCMSGFSMCACQ